MLKMLIAIDGSEHAQHAIEAVARLAANGCVIEAALLHVRDGPVYYGELPPVSIESLEEAQIAHQNAVLAAAQEQAGALKLKLLPSRRAVGFASAEIVREAAEMGAQQIVMGTRGLGSVRSLFIGSVAQRVVHEAAVPVLLVK